jgi:ankyrin repeat protein
MAGRANLVKLLIAHGADVNHKDHGGHPALLLAAFGAAVKGAPEWLAKSIFEIEDEDDDKVLQMLGHEQLESAKLLLDAGANVNEQGGDCGLTPLMVAALVGNVELAKLLLEHHADVNLNNGENRALKFAEMFDSPEELQKALGNCDDDEEKQALLKWAHFTAPGRKTIAEMLRKAGAK